MSLTDEQKIILHMCMQAEKTGHDTAWISRDDLLNGKCTPAGTPVDVRARLTWALLTMPKDILEWSADQRSFRLSADAIAHIRAKAAARLERAP